MAEQETLLEFPCDFPLKIMGESREGFAEAVVAVVQQHAPDFDAARIEMRASSGGKYISLTCTITATSKPQLDDLYRALTAHPWVKVVL
jgi:putative lipoic acid-binding regulatory protein